MKRLSLAKLLEWKDDKERKPLILRGARQVGKTYLVREFGKEYDEFIEINFEMNPELCVIFNENLDPENILRKISIALNKTIIPEKSLMFFDEIQSCPKALSALRYFYELRPDIHIISAGSLIEFLIQDEGIPVGRVRSLYIYPMNFYEFLLARGEDRLISILESTNLSNPIDVFYHNRLLNLLGEYISIGGMPEAVKLWTDTGDFMKVQRVHSDILETYRQDFHKYAKAQKIKYIEKIFNKIPQILGERFIFSHIDRNLKTRELRPALELLINAGLVHPIYHTSSNGIPLGSEVNDRIFKVIFLDIGLANKLLGINYGDWILDPLRMLVNNGNIAEAYVGQELISYSEPFIKQNLYYWLREKRGSQAEVDYIEVINNEVIPIEVKSGNIYKSKSLTVFLREKGNPLGIKFTQCNFGRKDNIIYLPLYAVFKIAEI